MKDDMFMANNSQGAPQQLVNEPSFVGDAAKKMPEPKPKQYFPLFDTLRLYAGWLLAWYCLVYAVGSYQFIKEVPVHIPYAESLFLSPLVLSFTLGAYLFLLLSSVYQYAGKKRSVGIGLFALGIIVFVLYRLNLQ